MNPPLVEAREHLLHRAKVIQAPLVHLLYVVGPACYLAQVAALWLAPGPQAEGDFHPLTGSWLADPSLPAHGLDVEEAAGLLVRLWVEARGEQANVGVCRYSIVLVLQPALLTGP